MKKILAAAASAALILAMTACGGSSSGNSGSSGASGSTASSASSTSSSQGSLASGGSAGGGELKMGIGVVTSTDDSEGATADYDGRASFNLTVCALCLGENDEIIDVRFDALEHEIGFDMAGTLTGDMGADILTKRELGDSYGLGNVSDIGMEWYEQMDALERWMRGKTLSEALEMKLTEEGDRRIPDEDDLRTSVTISVSDQLEALEKAYDDASGNSGGSGGSGSMSGAASGSESSSEGSLSDEVSGSSSVAQ